MSISSLPSQAPLQKINLSKLSKSLFLSLTMGSFTCLSAYAQQVTISDEVTTGQVTSTVNGGSPADIIIDEDGSIKIDSGTAITIDSDNDVTVNGNIINTTSSNGVGVHFTTTSGETLNSTLELNENMTVGEIDDNDNVGTNNYGILVDGDGTLEGDIIFGGSILEVIGSNSVGVSIQSDLIGSIEINTIGMNSENSIAVEILSSVSGDIFTKSNIEAGQENTHGIYIGADVGGAYRNRGSLIIGRNSQFNFNTRTTTPAIGGIAAVRIAANLGGGFSNEIAFFDSNGDEVFITEDQSTAGLSTDTSSILTYAGGYGLWISPEKIDGSADSDITIGNTGSIYGDYSVVNQGSIRAEGVNTGVDTTTILISGAVDGLNTYTTTLDNGIYNGLWGNIESVAVNATATALHLGDYASTPEFISNGEIIVETKFGINDDNELFGSGGDAYGVLIDANAQMGRFENNGVFTVTAIGPSSSAYGLVDHSGSITEFINTNFFSANIDEDSTGSSVAVDLSANTTSIDFHSSGNIIGDVYLGSGTNTITLEGITQELYDELYDFYADQGFLEETFIDLLDRNLNGTIFLEGGSATLDMTKNTVLTGGIYSPNGQLNVNLHDTSELRVLSDTPLNVENLTLNDKSTLVIEISGEDSFDGGVNASGAVTFSPDSQLKIDIQTLIGVQSEFEIISAGSLTIDDTSNIINATDQLFIYDITTTLDANSLSIGLRRKNATELGLSHNLAQIYEASIPALIANADVAAEISGIVTEEEFIEIYTQMMPNSITQASRQILINSNSLSLGAVSAQLDNLRRLKYIPDGKLLSGTSMWAQQYGTMYNHDETAYEKGASGFTFGIAAGYEIAVTKRGAIGISLSKNFADIKIDNAGLSRVGMENTQAGLYGGIWFGDFFVQGQANVGLLDFESDRDVLFQSGKRTSTANWKGLQYSSSIKTGYQLNLGSLSLTPTAAINYVNIKQDAYTETGGGGGIDLAVDEYKTSSMTSNLKMELAYTTSFGGDDEIGRFTIGIHGGWLNELKEDRSTVTANFAGYDSPFTLIGNPLAKNAYQAGVGMHFVTAITNFSLIYDVDWKDNYMAHSAMMNFRVRF